MIEAIFRKKNTSKMNTVLRAVQKWLLFDEHYPSLNKIYMILR